MPLSAASQLLADTLEALPLFEGRYAHLKLVNFDAVSDEKRGTFSLVFRADDQIEGKPVAIKFYDLDPRWTGNLYRRACFAREGEILRDLVSVARCLQLVQPMSTYNLMVPMAGTGLVIPIGCQYFVLEWLDEDIDRYFFEEDTIEPLVKLEVFNQIVLAIEALHRKGVFHRDLKADNFRVQGQGDQRCIVAIDLGTAAKYESGLIASGYNDAVGHLAYSAPEARSGFGGSRRLAPYTDVYALGCMLFELFNRDYFYNALVARNPGLDSRLASVGLAIPSTGTDEERMAALNAVIGPAARGVTSIRIDAPGNSADPATCPILNALVGGMTSFDYRRRPSLETVRQRIWIAIKILRNERAYQRRLEQVRARRESRLKKIEAAERRKQKWIGAAKGLTDA